MDTFYFGLSDNGVDRVLPFKDVMATAARYWKGDRFKDGQLKLTGTNPGELWLDSGGFTCFTKWGDYPFTVEEYHEFVKAFIEANPGWQVRASVMDLPCERDVNRDAITTNKARIERTIENTLKLLALAERDNLGDVYVPVIQGFTVDEYLYCITRMQEAGILGKWSYYPAIAIGSVCRRGSVKAIKEIILAIRREIPVTALHAFGLKQTALGDKEIYEALDSADSTAWGVFGDSHIRGHRFPKNKNERILAFEQYRRKMQGVIEENNNLRGWTDLYGKSHVAVLMSEKKGILPDDYDETEDNDPDWVSGIEEGEGYPGPCIPTGKKMIFENPAPGEKVVQEVMGREAPVVFPYSYCCFTHTHAPGCRVKEGI